MERFEYRVLTNKSNWLMQPRWRDGETLLPGRLRDILPGLGEEGWEVCGLASGMSFGIALTFQVILKRRKA